ncbi:MAG: hypothetical protein P4L46_17100 [Fimbriimonas sp.]|nr:hypothetical protein [Fimbriimonas sp.]
MADLEDIRRIASQLPGAEQSTEGFGFSVLVKGKHKGFLWPWMERIHPKKPKVPNLDVIAFLVPDLETKDELLASNTVAYLTEPHYNGFPAILVHIDRVDLHELEFLIVQAWRCKAPTHGARDSRTVDRNGD